MERSGQPRATGCFTDAKSAFCTHRIWGWVHCRASRGILEKIEGKCLCRVSNSIPVISARSLVATLTTLSRLSDEVQYYEFIEWGKGISEGIQDIPHPHSSIPWWPNCIRKQAIQCHYISLHGIVFTEIKWEPLAEKGRDPSALSSFTVFFF